MKKIVLLLALLTLMLSSFKQSKPQYRQCIEKVTDMMGNQSRCPYEAVNNDVYCWGHGGRDYGGY